MWPENVDESRENGDVGVEEWEIVVCVGVDEDVDVDSVGVCRWVPPCVCV